MTNVKELYKQYLSQGMLQKDAAKLAQQKTGFSVVTGLPINRQIELKRKYVGQYK